MAPTATPPSFVSSVKWANRQFARTSGDIRGTMIHFRKCYSTMQELFQVDDTMPHHHTAYLQYLRNMCNDPEIAFLDIACAPGGFSQFFLDYYQNSVGYGITLKEKFGGFPVLVNGGMDSTQNSSYRYNLCYFDLLSHPLDPAPSCPALVNIAIGDAQYFPRNSDSIDEYKGKKAGTVTGGRLGLLLREFILAFDSLKEGGVFIFRFVVWAKVHANIIKLFYLCFDLFDHVEPFKSEYQHTADCTFYAVCSGFNRKKYIELDIKTQLQVAFARVVISPPFAAVHNGTINCCRVIHPTTQGRPNSFFRDNENDNCPELDKPDAHILEHLYPFANIEKHPFFERTCNMFEYVYKMFLIGQASYTDHSII